MTTRRVLYWDTSAVLSALLADSHSRQARRLLTPADVHLVSSLTSAEFHAVLARLEREGHLAPVLSEAASSAYNTGPWRRVTTGPDPAALRPLAVRWPLRGADLWHLALARRLRAQIPELELLTFDMALRGAARGEGLA